MFEKTGTGRKINKWRVYSTQVSVPSGLRALGAYGSVSTSIAVCRSASGIVSHWLDNFDCFLFNFTRDDRRAPHTHTHTRQFEIKWDQILSPQSSGGKTGIICQVTTVDSRAQLRRVWGARADHSPTVVQLVWNRTDAMVVVVLFSLTLNLPFVKGGWVVEEEGSLSLHPLEGSCV